ncbi:hypothetical protein JO379_000780 [Streptomyces syringium]|uniref:RNA polymerase sigma factor 70 region 4 type 2 domain-containing protein n=1 Tax=Streptomyces syringium TaxID=76729 RepID=A0ABS4XXS6_9ACTN|nr:hypothetical protein [Streptomyces syringium]
MAFLVVLESMTPAERMAFVLHDVFRYPFAEIAEVLDRTPGACKQLASSARRRTDVTRPPVTATGRADVVRHVKEAWETKDIAALVGLLDPAAVMTADGGGMVRRSPGAGRSATRRSCGCGRGGVRPGSGATPPNNWARDHFCAP